MHQQVRASLLTVGPLCREARFAGHEQLTVLRVLTVTSADLGGGKKKMDSSMTITQTPSFTLLDVKTPHENA